MYDEGEGREQDFVQAVHWYRKAAEQGHAKAQNSLALQYYDGERADCAVGDHRRNGRACIRDLWAPL